MSRNPPGNPETQVLLSASAEEKRPPRKEAWTSLWTGGTMLGQPQFPLLSRGLTSALLSSLQVVGGLNSTASTLSSTDSGLNLWRGGVNAYGRAYPTPASWGAVEIVNIPFPICSLRTVVKVKMIRVTLVPYGRTGGRPTSLSILYPNVLPPAPAPATQADVPL